MTYLEHYKKTVYEGEEVIPSDEDIMYGFCVVSNYGNDAGLKGECNGTERECRKCWNMEMPFEGAGKRAEVPGVVDDSFDDASGVLREAFEETFHKAAEVAEKMTRDGVNTANSIKAAIERSNKNVTTLPKILDSGNRREFESGAVRDIQEGKGRCDLLPLDVVGECSGDWIFAVINEFQETGDVDLLYRIITKSCIFGDLPTLFLETSIHFEEGAKKYGDNNWRKGIPVRCYIDSAVRHYLKYKRGDKDEPHDRAFCWNIMCAIWTCKHHPELNEYDDITCS